MKKHDPKKALALAVETVRKLDYVVLTSVGGGGGVPTTKAPGACSLPNF